MNISRNLFCGLGAGVMMLMMADAANAAAPRNDWYGGLSGDATWLRHSDMGGGGNAALGYRFWPTDAGDFRLEGEVGYHAAQGSDGNGGTNYWTYMGNVYYDFNNMFGSSSNDWHIVPYIGGGLGDATVHIGDSATSTGSRGNTFAYQGMIGLSLASSSMPGTEWSLGYRYLGTDKPSLNSNSLELGARFHF